MKLLENYTSEELLFLQAGWENHLKYGNDYADTYKRPEEYNPSLIEDEIERRLIHYDQLIKENMNLKIRYKLNDSFY